ncbi:MAG: iron ABC transporter permease, partial [Acidimicrobiia bacterium]
MIGSDAQKSGYGPRIARQNGRGRAWLAVVPLAFLAVFFAYPVASIIATGLAPEGRLDLSVFSRVLTDPVLAGVAWFTIWQAAVSTVLTFLVALPGAYVVARYD